MTELTQYERVAAIIRKLPGAKKVEGEVMERSNYLIAFCNFSNEFEITPGDIENFASAAKSLSEARRFLNRLSIGAKQDSGTEPDTLNNLLVLEEKLLSLAVENHKSSGGQIKEHEPTIADCWLETVESVTGQEATPRIADDPFAELMEILRLKGSVTNLLSQARKRKKAKTTLSPVVAGT